MGTEFVVYYPRALAGNGGPTVAMWNWVKSLTQIGQSVIVLYDERLHSNQSSRVPGAHVVPVKHRLWGRFRYPVGLSRYLSKDTILILHSAFLGGNLLAALTATLHGSYFILTPHGAYGREARQRRRLQKKAWLILEAPFANRALAIHSFVETEIESILEIAPKAKVIVAPTGAAVPSEILWHGGGGYAAWIGRYDIDTKGLDILVDAYRQLPPRVRMPLIMRGRDSKNTCLDVHKLVASAGVEKHIAVRGPIEGNEKDRFLCNAELFIMPSRFESFSIALVEALAIGVPTIASSAMPIAPRLSESRACLIVRPEATALADTLSNYFDGNVPIKSLAPRDFVEENLGHERVGRSFVDQIEWLIAEKQLTRQC